MHYFENTIFFEGLEFLFELFNAIVLKIETK